MEFSFDAASRTLTCRFEGRIRSDEADSVGEAIDQQWAEIGGTQDCRIIFDMGGVDYVSSAFLRVVIVSVRRVAKGNFSMVNANQFITDLMRTTQLDKIAKIESVMKESRVFEPSGEFAAAAEIRSMDEYLQLHQASIDDPDTFWAERAREELEWFEPFEQVYEWDEPDAKWFLGGKLNVSHNCLDRHLGTATANKAALIWEGEPAADDQPGEMRTLTYRQLHREVCRFSNVLKQHAVGRGDRVLIYMPMVPEAAIAMLACARIGAIHSVVFGGFSANAVAERVLDCEAKLILTADGAYRRGKVVPLKDNVDEALTLTDEEGQLMCASIQKVIVLQRTDHGVELEAGRDVWWHEELATADANCPAEPMDSEDVLFILYTSGSTGKPKGIFHSTAGYLLGTKLTHRYVFDLKETDVYWCTADVGWITGHSYIVYGPLANGATVLMYEGAPNYPEPDRFWQIVEKYGVTIFYTAPTAVRAFMKWGDEWPNRCDLSSLRLLGTVGEPINPEAWMWYHEVIGGKRCPIVDTWWQTETGGIMITPLPGAVPTKPGSATVPFFGVQPEIVDENGQLLPANTGGMLAIAKPWPSMLRGVWGDPQRYYWTYWKDIPGKYFTGDGARVDEDGYFWIVGRVDDVLNVSGHRIGTAEVESALVSNSQVAEAAVVGRPDDIKGSAVVAFVTLRGGNEPSDELQEELRKHVGNELGPVAKPEEIRFAEALPKTRSGKIMRRLLRQVAAGAEITGDVTTLEDFNVLSRLTGEEG